MTPKTKILHYLPRILCITAILFTGIFALDAFEAGKSLSEQITVFFIQLIPSFILLVLLIIAWKYELTGGIIFCILALVFTPVIFNKNYDMNNSFWLSIGIVSSITIPFLIVGILFISSYFQKKKQS